MVLLSILIMMVAFIILMDLVPLIKDWLGRIHIGRYANLESWNKAVILKGIQWLNHTPKIKVTDNTRLIIIDKLKGNYSNKAIQYWQEAALLLGLTELLKVNNDEQVRNEIKKFLKSKFDSQGQWKRQPETIDCAILAYAVMKIDFINIEHYQPAFEQIWTLIKKHIGSDGTVQYRKHMADYRYVDTIGFICPFLVSYGTKFNNQECIELAVYQINEFEKNGMLEEHHIPFHAYKTIKNIPLGLNGWGRGLGWFAIGLIDAWDELPNKHKDKIILSNSVKKFADVILSFQQKKGSWNWSLIREEAFPDSSTTATLAWYLVKASKIDDIKIECLQSAQKAINYLMTVTRRNGAIDFSQGDTKDIGVYSSNFNILPFTQGFALRTYTLLQKVKEERVFHEDIKLSKITSEKISI